MAGVLSDLVTYRRKTFQLCKITNSWWWKKWSDGRNDVCKVWYNNNIWSELQGISAVIIR